MVFEATRIDNSLGPLERGRVLVPGSGELVDGLANLPRVGSAQVPEHRAGEDAEPHLHLVQPRGMGRRVVEAGLGVPRQPAVVLGLVGTQVVQDDVKLRVGGYSTPTKEPLPAPVSLVLSGLDVSQGC